MERGDGTVPSADGLANFVDAFRHLERIGDGSYIALKASSRKYSPSSEDIAGTTFHTKLCYGSSKWGAPWVAAFTQWCIGLPPSILLDYKAVALQQASSRIILIAICDPTHQGLPVDWKSQFIERLERHRSWFSLSYLVSEWPCQGCLASNTIDDGWWKNENLDSEMGPRVLKQGLPYGLRLVNTILYLYVDSTACTEDLTTVIVGEPSYDCKLLNADVLHHAAYSFPEGESNCKSLIASHWPRRSSKSAFITRKLFDQGLASGNLEYDRVEDRMSVCKLWRSQHPASVWLWRRWKMFGQFFRGFFIHIHLNYIDTVYVRRPGAASRKYCSKGNRMEYTARAAHWDKLLQSYQY